MIIENWRDTCLVRADRRAVGHILFALMAFAVVLMIGWLWLTVLAVPVVLELAAPGLRHFFTRRGTLQLIEQFPFRPLLLPAYLYHQFFQLVFRRARPRRGGACSWWAGTTGHPVF